MSKPFFLALGLTMADLTPVNSTVGTAKAGEELTVLGKLKKPVYLQLDGLKTKFKTYPVVVDHLSMPFNIGAPFLKRHGIDQFHSRNTIRVQGRHLPLIATVNIPTHEKLVLDTYVSDHYSIPPMSQSIINLNVPDVAKGLCPAGDGFLTGSIAFMGKTNLHPVLDTFVTCSTQGNIVATVLNTTSDTVELKKNVGYGSFRLARAPPPSDESSSHPWRVLALTKVEGGQAPTSSSFSSSSPERPSQNSRKTQTDEPKQKKDKPTQKELDEIIQRFKLNKSPFLTDSRKLYQAALLLYQNRKAFSFDGSFGKTTLIEHQICTEPGQKPINQKFRPVNPMLEKDLKEQIDKWLQHGVIEESNSPWNFGLVAAPKKNGKIRWCVDYRALNKVTTKDSHPIGNIDDNLSRLSRSTIFSCIDGSGAYHVVQLDPKDKIKTAFATPWGSYQFTHMPFGLCNAPSTYARLVQMVLQGIPYNVALPYLDDTIVHSKNLEEHFASLDRVLKANTRAGLKLSPEKCSFFCDQVAYLGHVVSEKGIFPNPDYLKVVADWPIPNTRSKVRTFLGKTGYYRRFIHNYAQIAGPLLDQLKRTELDDKAVFELTSDYKRAFQLLKEQLLKAPILAYPQFDSNEPFILDTDWSADNNAVGAVLSQKQEGIERVICYGAKRLTKAQTAYSPTKGELAGVIIFMQKWKYFLQHRQFVLRTDHKALCWIKTMVEPTGMIQRWLDILACFDFIVEHRPGPKHGNADALSRAAHLSPATSETDLSQGERVAAMSFTRWDPDMIRQEQTQDSDISFIMEWVRQGEPPTREALAASSRIGKLYGGLYPDLSFDDHGVLRYTSRSNTGGLGQERQLVLLPRNLWSEAVWKAHEAAAHMAAQATTNKALQHFYFPGMLAFAERLLRTCQPCQMKVGNSKDQKALLRASVSGYPFQKLSLDFVGPLPTSSQGNTYILTVLDTFTRWLEAFPLRAATADRVVKVLVRDVFSRYGLCEQLHSDRGSQFTGDLLSDVAKTLGISHTQTPAYNPKSNPVERQHRTLQQALTALITGNPRRWEHVLPHALFAMRTTISRPTGFAPFQLMFGRDAASNLDLIFGTPRPEDTSITEYATQLRNDALVAHEWARRNIGKTIARQRRAYHADAKIFIPGQKVWLFTPRLRPGQSKKFATYWTGPWTVLRKLNDLMFEIDPDSSWLRKSPETVSIDRLKPFFESELDSSRQFPPSPSADLSMAGDEHAEFLTAPSDEEEQGDDLFFPLPADGALADGADGAAPLDFDGANAHAPAPLPVQDDAVALPGAHVRHRPSRSPSPILAPPRSRSPSPPAPPPTAAPPYHPGPRPHQGDVYEAPVARPRPQPYAVPPREPHSPEGAMARPTPTQRERARLEQERRYQRDKQERQAAQRQAREARRQERAALRDLPPPSPPPDPNYCKNS